MPSKRKSQRIHLRRRWEERVGGTISNRLHDKLVEMIKSGKSKPVRSTSNRVTIHAIIIEDQEYRVAYDKQRKQLVTVLPKEKK